MRNPSDPLDRRVRAISLLAQQEWKLEVDQVKRRSDPAAADELHAVRGIKLALVLTKQASRSDLDKLSGDFRLEITRVHPDIDPFRPGLGFGPFGPDR